jgi:hypothetical protein
MREVVGSSPTATTISNLNFLTRFTVDHVACNVEPLNYASKRGELRVWSMRVSTLTANTLRLDYIQRGGWLYAGLSLA